MPHLVRLRERTGRPHWLVIDEAHQFLPRDQATDTPDLGSAILLTVDPEWLARSALAQVDAVLAFGQAAGSQVRAVADALGVSRPATPAPAPNEALYWYADAPAEAQIVTIAPPRQAHHRHKGKYAIGDVGDSHAFVFTGPGGQPLGTARNLADFLRLAGRCGDRDWDRHLRSGDFTAWFHDVIRDEELGRRAMALASDPKVSASESRALIRDAIVSRYLIPDDAG